MPIPVQTIIDEVAAQLGAEGNDYYLFDRDYKPAINQAINKMTELIRNRLGSNKFSEEAVAELRKTVVYQTNLFSRFKLVDDIFSVEAVHCEIATSPSSPTLTPTSNNYESFKRSDVAFINTKHTAKRLTPEEFYVSQEDPFAAGFRGENRNIITYSYALYNNFDTSGAQYQAGGAEISVSPELNQKFVAITQINLPTEIDAEDDNVDFPVSVKNIIVMLVAYFMSYKPLDTQQVNLTAYSQILEAVKSFD